MSTLILATKLYIPSPPPSPPPQTRPKVVSRPRLIKRLNEGLHHKLTLVSAPAGFGKTTLVSQWVAQADRPAAWLSLDGGDNDPTRFLAYLVAALQTITPRIGAGLLAVLQSTQPPPIETMLTALLNEITTIPDDFLLVLDDYHLINAPSIHHALTFLLEHLPPRMHLVIATREDPPLPLARLRVRGQLTELHIAELRFIPAEAAEFLNRVIGLKLSADDIAALETRTEGWIAGLQLAGISMQGHQDTTSFIKSFTGSHHFVLDYLVEEVLHQQSENIQTFLLNTSILDRMCGPLCDAVLPDATDLGQHMLEMIERANLFIVPLDNERRWYRYHHLFADLLRQRLQQHSPASITDLHTRASIWYEDHGLELEAFHHAAAAGDIERAERLMDGGGMPLLFRGAVTPVLNWFESLPTSVLDARPSLWVMYAFACMSAGQATGIEQKLEAAEAALQTAAPDHRTQDNIGRIAAIRAMLAIPENQVDTMLTQARRALEHLHPTNLPVRTATTWALGYAYQLLGDRVAAKQAYSEVIPISDVSGNTMFNIAATSGLGSLQEADNQLYLAAETYRRVLELAGDPPLPHANGALLGLAQIHYEWNDLDSAERYGEHGIELARQIESIDVPASAGVILARVKLARGDVDGANAALAEADQFVRLHNFVFRLPELAAARVLILLYQGEVDAAAHLANQHDLPLSQARVHLAQGDPSAALALLEPVVREAEAKGYADDLLRALIVQVIAYQMHGETDTAVQRLGEALALAEPGGFVRTFTDEGALMAQVLSEAAARGMRPTYVHHLLTAFESGESPTVSQTLLEPLSERELEVLKLVAQGLSNHEISQRLFLALDTVKGHNRRIYGKLQVQRRTEAVARARELGLLEG